MARRTLVLVAALVRLAAVARRGHHRRAVDAAKQELVGGVVQSDGPILQTLMEKGEG